MQTINVKRVQAKRRRTATALINDIADDGQVLPVELTIHYRGLSLGESDSFKDLEEIEGEEARTAEIVRQLGFMVEEIPNFVDDDGKPVEIDEQFFRELDVVYLNAISAAIRAQRSVPTRPSAS